MVQKMKLGFTHKIMGEKEIDIVVKSSSKKTIDNKSAFFVSGYDVL